ncbi:MAG: zinc ribbon domain-containing protein [Candidatus Hydrogenedens sp.]|nr:zinc ribbon domain-containing protein [Candidatus Hydrogenedentota bacterium]NLF58392.1 zinc ribbon domain-containing protein [Candidatus Hydrogenedens sp.]
MPTYTYKCKKCGHEQDEFHTMSAAPRVRCGACGGLCAKQLGMGAGIIFKGSGFYETDYKKKSGGDGAKKSGASETKTGEAKPAGDGGASGAAKTDGKAKAGAAKKD